MTLLSDDDPIAGLHAAATLAEWGRKGDAVPSVIGLLDEEHDATRSYAAELLVSWSTDREAAETLLAQLDVKDQEVFDFFVSGDAAALLGARLSVEAVRDLGVAEAEVQQCWQ